jgi:DNA invertase Pin-like site-specific DNA recombinase
MTSTVRAVVYARISVDPDKDKHANGGAGIDRQIERCELLAAAREWDLIRDPLIDNDRSAFSGKTRPAFDELMGMIDRREVGAVVVWHIDRLCRRVSELVDIARLCLSSGVRIASVSGDIDFSSPSGRLFATILIAVAEYESAHKGERQAAAYEQLAGQGHRHYGPRTFGYVNGKQDDDGARNGQRFVMVVQPDEAAAVQWAAEHVIAGGSIAGVVREWTRRGVTPTRSGGKWTRSSVLTILANPAIAGLRARNGEIVGPAKWEPVISEQLWRAVQAVLASPERKRVRGTRTLLGGIGCCGCGCVLQGAVDSKGRHVYRCNRAARGDRPGPHCVQQQAPVNDWVTEVIVARLSRSDLAEVVVPKRDLTPLYREAEAIRANLEELAADRALNRITHRQMLVANERANARLDEITAQISKASQGSVLAVFDGGQPAREVWERLDLSKQRAVLDALCSVVVLPAGRGRREFDRETVQITPRNV